ncbi:MAG: bacteriohopanetetrol glucosamine biosynthesis glycosyltransferase HpnI [Anaerolineae bacterium]
MAPWSLALLALTAASWAYWVAACWCVARFFAERQPQPGNHRPPVSILKPVRGLDADAYENFASFMRQDYPEYEVLFGVTDPHDPVLSLIARLQAEFPQRKIRAFVAPPRGANDKVSILCHLSQQAYYDTLVICDSDMRVTPDYLSRVCAPLRDENVGLVTCPYRGEQAESLTAQLEAQYMGTTFLPSVLIGRHYLRMGFAMGATNAITREQLRRIGGFEVLLDYLADDYQLGARVSADGRRVHLSDYMTRCILGKTTFRDQWRREVRWAKCTRVSRPTEYPSLLLTFATPLALLTAASLGFSALGLALLGATLLMRWGVAWFVTGYTGDRVVRRAWPWLPLRDLLSVAVWCAAGLGGRVSWRDRCFALRKDGRLQPLPPQRGDVARVDGAEKAEGVEW